jgi:hypothetical protein
MKMIEIAYRLWLSIIGISQIGLSMSFYYINSGLNQLLKDLENKSEWEQIQTEVHDIPVMLSDENMSQLQQLRKNSIIRVAVVDNKAYWVHNNTFYESDIVDGCIDNDAARPIDAIKLSSNEIDDLLEILDNIKK